MKGRYSIEEAVAILILSEQSRKELVEACNIFNCRLQIEVGMRSDYYFHSVGVIVHHGGRFWRVPNHGSCRM
eukprot:10618369-Karenia_brevis.AAC.1